RTSPSYTSPPRQDISDETGGNTGAIGHARGKPSENVADLTRSLPREAAAVLRRPGTPFPAPRRTARRRPDRAPAAPPSGPSGVIDLLDDLTTQFALEQRHTGQLVHIGVGVVERIDVVVHPAPAARHRVGPAAPAGIARAAHPRPGLRRRARGRTGGRDTLVGRPGIGMPDIVGERRVRPRLVGERPARPGRAVLLPAPRRGTRRTRCAWRGPAALLAEAPPRPGRRTAAAHSATRPAGPVGGTPRVTAGSDDRLDPPLTAEHIAQRGGHH